MPKIGQRDAKRRPRDANGTPRGGQEHAREAKGRPREAKGMPKGGQERPKAAKAPRRPERSPATRF